jgi:hypothetical protein
MGPTLANPAREYLALAVLLALCAAANLAPGFRRGFDRLAAGLAGWLRRRGLFTLTDPARVQRRLDAFRVLLGLAALYRCSGNLCGSFAQHWTLWLPQLVSTALSALLLVGLLTPVAALALLLVQDLWVVPHVYHVYNLPSVVMVVALFPLLLTPAGRSLSLDAWLLRRGGRAGRALARVYGGWGDFHPDRYALGLFASLLGYALVSLSACLNHLDDHVWRSGLANAWLLISPRINLDYHRYFDSFYAYWPRGFLAFAVVSTWGMLAWEALLLPLALWRRTRWFVVIWGLAFFAVSWFVLRLRYLVAAEVVLWLMLFWPARQAPGDEPAPAPTGWPFRAWSLSFVVLVLAFLTTMPGLERWGPAAKLRAGAARLLGQAPFAYGLTQVVVFDQDDECFERDVHLATEQGSIRAPDESACYRSHWWFFQHRSSAGLIELGTTPKLWDGLCRNLQFAGTGDPVVFAVRVRSGPTEKDFWAGRYVPQRSLVVCRAGVDPETREVRWARLTREGLDEVLGPYDLPGRVDLADAWLLPRFPVIPEINRVAYWYGLSGLRAREGENRRAVDRLNRAIDRHAGTVGLLPVLVGVVEQLRLDWHPRRCPPPPAADCTADLALARAYFHGAFDDEMREKLRGEMDGAERSARAGDVPACLLHVGAVRRAYFERLFRRPR